MIDNKIDDKTKSISALEKTIEENKVIQLEEDMKMVESKIDTFENNLKTVKKCLEEKDANITKLENRVTQLENS